MLPLSGLTLIVAAASSATPAQCLPASGVSLRIPDVGLVCGPYLRDCHAKLVVVVVNCGDGPTELERLDFRVVKPETAAPHTLSLPSWSVTFDPRSFVVPAGAERRFEESIIVEATVTVSGQARIAGRASRLTTARALVTNPARDAARSACRACRGDWGPQGMMQLEGCNCRTKDAGRTCRDGRDCEAACLLERTDRHGRPVGRCSEFQTMWSCQTIIPVDAARQGFPLDRICTD